MVKIDYSMFKCNLIKNNLSLEEFEREDAIASQDKGQSVIPVWLDQIYQQLARRLNG